MNKYRPFIAFLLTFLIVLGVTFSQKPLAATAEGLAEEGNTNHVYIDVTYDPNAKTYSIGGFSEGQLKQLGAPGLQDEIYGMLAALADVNLKVDGQQFNLMVDSANLATLDWNKESRAFLYGMIDSYGNMPLIDQTRAEAWLEKAQVEIALRKSPEVSKPLVIELATLVNVDITNEGVVSVEGFNTGTSLTPEVIQMVQMGKINTAAVCWDKGRLVTALNGSALPMITLYPEGLGIIDKAFNLNVGDISQLFQSKLGASVVYGEGDHATVECTK
jgi:hypothetical protein